MPRRPRTLSRLLEHRIARLLIGLHSSLVIRICRGQIVLAFLELAQKKECIRVVIVSYFH